jgi:hypothetical protein
MAGRTVPKTTRVSSDNENPQGVHSSVSSDGVIEKKSGGLIQWIKG